MAKKYHPDVNSAPDAKQKFEKIATAYETLTDDSKRSAYDEKQGFSKTGTGFKDFHGGAAQDAARKAAFSDDEDWYDLKKKDGRTNPFARNGKAEQTEESKWR